MTERQRKTERQGDIERDAGTDRQREKRLKVMYLSLDIGTLIPLKEPSY